MNEKLDILFVNPDPRCNAGRNISLLGVISNLDKTRFHALMVVLAITSTKMRWGDSA